MTLDNIKKEWKPRGVEYLFDSIRGSKLHQEARKILKEKHKTLAILEEVSIPVRKRKTLYLDFYIPSLSTAIEVQGQQHSSFNSMYHKNVRDFINQKKNDREKAEWCKKNDIHLVELLYNEVKEWKDQI